MKRKLSVAALLVCCVTVAFAAFADLSGKWKGVLKFGDMEIPLNYTFKVEGNELKGTWKTQFGETKIENGKVDGNKFSYSITFNDMTIKSTGEVVNENELLIKNERGEMKLTRVKQ